MQPSFLKDLNSEQKAAVQDINGPSLIIAGAGSGKTRVLTYRIAYLLEQGVPPRQILSLTFTNKAAREMKDRIAQLVGYKQARELWMGTFHSIFSQILRREAKTIGFSKNYSIYDTLDSKNLVKSIIRDLELDDKVYKPNDIQRKISNAKNNLITPKAYRSSTEIQAQDQKQGRPLIADIYTKYVARCVKADAMDFDDLLLQTNILFRDHPEKLKAYQEYFKYILVDEYQDTNYAQYLIVKKLGAKHNNVCVVGDDSQSIYSFRGAKIENIIHFRNDYKDYKLYKLEQNYRSTKTIVEAANSVIAHNNYKIPKQVWSGNEDGPKIKIKRALTDNEEGFQVANDIVQSRINEDFEYKDYAILYRTNAQSRIFEEALRKHNIPYKIYGGLSFYQRKEIKDVLAYLRIIINPNDDEALKRILNYPPRGIGKKTIETIENYATQNQLSLWHVISDQNTLTQKFQKRSINNISAFVQMILQLQQAEQNTDAYDLATQIVSNSGILKYLSQDQSPENLSRYENIQELLNGIKEFTENYLEENGENATLGIFLENVALLTDKDTETEEDENNVTLMTVHSAKGLEFKKTYLVGVEEYLFPLNNSSVSSDEAEEERRLFYVALTRAEKQAWISYSQSRYKWGNLMNCLPSRFLREIEPQYLDIDDETYQEIFGIDKINKSVSNHDQHKQGAVNGSPKKNFKTRITEETNQKNSKNVNSHLLNSNKLENFVSDNPDDIQTGMVVEHPRFGQGKVLQIEGDTPNKKATVFFNSAGQKRLLLKFAKLKIKNSET